MEKKKGKEGRRKEKKERAKEGRKKQKEEAQNWKRRKKGGKKKLSILKSTMDKIYHTYTDR